jgi:hypothetical protein
MILVDMLLLHGGILIEVEACAVAWRDCYCSFELTT